MAADEELGTGSITITLDDSTADAAANRLGDRIERVLDRASRDAGLRMERNIKAAIRRISPVSVRVEADLRAFGHSIDTLNNFDPITIPVNPDVDRAQFEAAIEAVLVGLEVSVRVVPDLDGFDAAIRAHNTPTVTVDVNADTDRFGAALGRLGGIAGRAGGALGGLLKFGAVGIAAAGATQSIVGLTAALAPAVGLLAAVPAVALGAVAANAALKLALNGVSDAFGAALTGDAEAFSKSLEKLSPAAQAAAKEVRALKPAFEELRTSVQDAFFQQIEGEITATASALQGPLLAGLTNISSAWGNAAKGALDYVQSADGVGNVQSILKAATQGVEGLADTTTGLTAGFLSVAASVSDAFGERFSSALAGAGTRFGTFLQEAASSGKAVAWVDGAITALSQLGSVLANVGSILGGVFEAASASGGGFLGNLKQITASFAEFVNSAQGQEAIGNLFATISSIAAQLGPILAALVTQVGAIAPALAPVFETLGPAIVSVIDALGPALAAIAPSLQTVAGALSDALGQIADSGALTQLGAALGSVLEAVSPLLPVIGQLVASIGTALAPVVSALAAALAPVITALAGALTPILPPLTSAFVTLATALTPLITLLGTTLGEVITALAPAFSSIAEVIAQVATALAPLIAQVTSALVPAFQMLAPLIAQNVAAFTPLIEQLVSALLPALPPIVEAFTAVFNALIPIVPVVLQIGTALVPLVSTLISAIGPVIQFGAQLLKLVAVNVVAPIITRLVAVIRTIVGAVTAVISAVGSFASRVIGVFNSVRSSVTGAVLGLVSTVTGAFRSMTNGITSVLGGLIGRAKSAVSGAAIRALVSAGADLIRGMINGIKSMAGSLVSAAKGVVSGAVDGAKSLLGISSPSKVFAEIGKFVGQGFIKGLQGTEADIRQAAEQVIGKIRDAFKGKNTRLDDRLIAQVQATTKRLTKLAADREAIAEKIKKANELAASVTQNALSAFSLQNLAKNGGGVQQLTDGIESAITQIQKFNSQINSLAKRGLRKDLLQQIIGLGPEQGAALATSLAGATADQLDDLNEAQKQLAAASKKLGRDSADNLFDAGKEASKGFLAGLKAQQDDVEDLMLTLARAMAKSIRAALGIKSPSRVFRQIGRYTMDGLSVGVEERLNNVRRSVLGAASAITDPFGGSGSLGSIAVTSGRQAATGGRGTTAASRSQVNHITINEVGDGQVTADRILNRLALAGGGL